MEAKFSPQKRTELALVIKNNRSLLKEKLDAEKTIFGAIKNTKRILQEYKELKTPFTFLLYQKEPLYYLKPVMNAKQLDKIAQGKNFTPREIMNLIYKIHRAFNSHFKDAQAPVKINEQTFKAVFSLD